MAVLGDNLRVKENSTIASSNGMGYLPLNLMQWMISDVVQVSVSFDEQQYHDTNEHLNEES